MTIVKYQHPGQALFTSETSDTVSAQWHSLTSDYAVASDTLFEFQSAMHELRYLGLISSRNTWNNVGCLHPKPHFNSLFIEVYLAHQ
jgi:hypothetical protein